MKKPWTVHDQLRESILSRSGVADGLRKPDLECMMTTEWSPEFEKLMRNRLLMGCFRYGSLQQANKPKYDKINSIRQRLDLYEQGGNAEHLVDIANLCLVEFVDETHPNFHFKAQDDTTHAKEITK